MNFGNQPARAVPSTVCNVHCSCRHRIRDTMNDNRRSGTFCSRWRDLTSTTTTTNIRPSGCVYCYHKSVCGYYRCYYYYYYYCYYYYYYRYYGYYYCLDGCGCWSMHPLNCNGVRSLRLQPPIYYYNRSSSYSISLECHRCMEYLQRPDNVSNRFVHPSGPVSLYAPHSPTAEAPPRCDHANATSPHVRRTSIMVRATTVGRLH